MPPTPGPDARAVERVDTAPKEIDPLADPNGVLGKRSVFFDFDRFDVRSEFQPISDMRASASYRCEVLGNLMQRFWLESQGVQHINLESFRLEEAVAP